jgi:xanthine dehydrogenase accessory factor
MTNLFESLADASVRGESLALALISGIKGSSPQKKGAKAIFFGDGRMEGTLGGGCLEAEIQQRARQALLSGKPEQFELVLDHDFGWDDGLICGGKVLGLILPQPAPPADLWRRLSTRNEALTWGIRPDFSIGTVEGACDDWLFTETVSPACALWIAGAGHVARAVAPLAARLDFDVTVIDDRAALANHRFFPAETRFRVDYWEEALQDSLPPHATFGLIVTRGHQHDALVLRHWIQRPFVFLGMIGSRRKKRLIFDQFVAEGLATPEQLARVACPVGLEILAHTVDEIALSIVAQLAQCRAQRVYGRVPKSSAAGLGQPLCAIREAEEAAAES